MTLAAHLHHRNDEGWKLTDLEWIGYVEDRVQEGKYSRQQGDILVNPDHSERKNIPNWVRPVPRFHKCLKVLGKMFDQDLPPIVNVRSASCMVIVYGFVDASGSGFGSTLMVKGNINYRIGTWSSKEDSNSSNWREFENLVCEVETAGTKGWLNNNTVLLATDNQVVEACLYKGNSSSVKLFDLVVRLKLTELKYGVKILVTHVSGSRMQAQGTDGVSRGNLRDGISLGKEMLEFCPWGKDALKVSPALKAWIMSWAGSKVIFLSPRDWYLRGQDIAGGSYNEEKYWYPHFVKGVYIWIPPPAASDACLEELRKARMKRKVSLHIVVIPRLMTPLWLKQLSKAADCIFTVPPTHPFWPKHCFESLTIAFLFPYLPYRPFQLKSTPKMLYMGRKLSKMFKENQMDSGNILLEFLLEVGRYPSMSRLMVWRMLYFGRSPPFPLCLSDESHHGDYPTSGWKRENHEEQTMERKRAKPS